MLCYSTGSLPDDFSFSRIADVLAGSPFLGVELVVTPAMLERAADRAYWRGVRDLFHALGLAFRNVHLGMPHLLGPEAHRPGLSALDPTARARKAEAAKQALAIAAFLDCPHVCLTTGLPEPGAGPEVEADQLQALEWEISLLALHRPAGVSLLVEQEPEHVIRSATQLKALGEAFPDAVFANYDVGHGQVLGENIPAAIRSLGPLLLNVHLEDIRGRVHKHLLFGEGDVDFVAVFAAFRDVSYSGDYTPDLYPFKDDWERAMAASVAFLREHGVIRPL